MPYTTNTLSYLAGGPVEGAWKLWEYTTTDAISTVLGSGYVADATIKAMAVGDFVIVVNQTNPQGYILQVQSVTAASGNIPGAATLVVPAGVNAPNPAFPRNLIDGGDFTTNPWQRGHELYRHQQCHGAGGLYGRPLVRLQQQCQRVHFGVAGYRNNGHSGVLSRPCRSAAHPVTLSRLRSAWVR